MRQRKRIPDFSAVGLDPVPDLTMKILNRKMNKMYLKKILLLKH